MRCSLQDIFERHFDDYARTRKLHPREARAAWCIRHCFTPACGAHVLACPLGHFEQLQCHACRHRSCPRCADRPRQAWIDARLQRLLPCPHFHVVFTLPHALLALWAFNRATMASLLLQCVRDTLLALMAEPRLAGVRPALLMALHTWGRDLSRHPHVHCLLSAGGITPNGLWKPTAEHFLLPLKPLQALFRGKLLARLKTMLLTHQLALAPQQPATHWMQCIRELYRAHWNVQIQPPYTSARGVALYLARYLKGGPVPVNRPLSLDAAGLVRMPYTDHRDGRTKTLCLSAHDFIERVLWHAPPPALHLVRYAGLYASAFTEQYRLAHQALCPNAQPPITRQATPPATPNPPATPITTCPRCDSPLVQRPCPWPAMHQLSEFSLKTSSPVHATVHLGPTGRCNGHSTAGRSTPLSYSRLRAAGC